MLLRQPEDICHHLAEVAADLHRRAFPPQHHAGAQGADTAEELDRQHPPPPYRTQLVHGPLNLGNAGTTRLGRKGMGQEIANATQQGAETKAEQAELPPGAIGQQVDTLLCQPVHAGLEQSADQPGQGADQRRQQQHQQGHLVLMNDPPQDGAAGR